ncbi:hypothetical protein [Noviherbaspirillum saxi]|uniref:Uncharacterized protein n=1 Tax=Noviherbaspirillum saxi TaxID=2320863 RepID=A0A3A3FXZ2_9BURK|nr:hypothetical protein [Noviherbaspirillum saxi]RJF99071.1 hypothetical protein D3871_11505 [Noviherbaspirillum saxi]
MTTTTVLEALELAQKTLRYTSAPFFSKAQRIRIDGEVTYIQPTTEEWWKGLRDLIEAAQPAIDAAIAANAKPDQVDATAQEPLTFDIMPCGGSHGLTGYRVWMRRGGASRVVFSTHDEPSANHELAELQRMFGDAAVPQPAQAQQEPVVCPDHIAAEIRDMISTYDRPSLFSLAEDIYRIVVQSLHPEVREQAPEKAGRQG